MKKVIIYTDGGSRGNPGPSATGVVFCNEKNEPFKKYSDILEDGTNNEAEYKAVIFSLKKFKALFGKKIAETSDLEIRSDSELLVNQLNGKYKIENQRMGELFLEIWNLKMDFKSVKFKQIPREKNKEADRLVNEALDGKTQIQKLI
jgi:ribonuclease HI